MSESEGEEVATQEVTLPQNLPGRGNIRSTQSSVRLTEVGGDLTGMICGPPNDCGVVVAGATADSTAGEGGGWTLHWRSLAS